MATSVSYSNTQTTLKHLFAATSTGNKGWILTENHKYAARR